MSLGQRHGSDMKKRRKTRCSRNARVGQSHGGKGKSHGHVWLLVMVSHRKESFWSPSASPSGSPSEVTIARSRSPSKESLYTVSAAADHQLGTDLWFSLGQAPNHPWQLWVVNPKSWQLDFGQTSHGRSPLSKCSTDWEASEVCLITPEYFGVVGFKHFQALGFKFHPGMKRILQHITAIFMRNYTLNKEPHSSLRPFVGSGHYLGYGTTQRYRSTLGSDGGTRQI